jgi:hypothetical protein
MHLFVLRNHLYMSFRSSDKKRKKSTNVETDGAEEQVKKKKKPVAKVESPAEEISDDEEAAEPAPKQSKKKEKKVKDTSKEEQTIESPAAKSSNSSTADSASKKGASNSSPFQRVKAEEVTYLKVKGGQNEAQRLKDNTFESKVLPLQYPSHPDPPLLPNLHAHRLYFSNYVLPHVLPVRLLVHTFALCGCLLLTWLPWLWSQSVHWRKGMI